SFGTQGTLNSNNYWLLTAWHCYDPYDDRVWNGAIPASEIGPVTAWDTQEDIAQIQVSKLDSHCTAPIVYEGGVGTDNHTKPVVGVGHLSIGLFVCESGSFIRTVCDTKVVDDLDTWTVQNPYTRQYADIAIGDGFQLESVATGQPVAASRGDSGGPVFRLTGP